jgi:Reverse transcriptase (RNA-dependent DNA polymerase)
MSFITVYKNRLHQALQMAVLDLEEGHAPDPFRYSDYNLQNPSFLDRIEVSLRQGLYRPNLPLEVSFPKSEFAIRPGKRIELEDLVVVYYCLIAISEDLEDKLKAGVTAYRIRRGTPPTIVQQASLILPRYLRKRMQIIDPWYNAWPKFMKRLRREYVASGRRFVGTSDITSFYEDVDLGLLRAGLSSRVRKGTLSFVNLLVEMYQGWATRDIHSVRQNRGLPQGTSSSGVIANYFLMPFDDELYSYARAKGLRWFRYNDDMRLLGAKREDVRLGLRRIGQHLGRLNLIQQGSKTRILFGSRAREDLFDTRGEKISTLVKKIQSKKKRSRRSHRSILGKLDDLLATVKDTSRKTDSTTLIMLYTAYRQMRSDRLLRRWKKDYLREPARTRSILAYVSEFLDRPGQCKSALKLLERQRKTATDWELAQFLRTFRRMNYLPPDAKTTLRFLSQSKALNWYVRQQAVLTIGWFCLTTEAYRLSGILDTEWDDEVRRAILTILFLLPHEEERKAIRRAARDLSPKVSRMANFLLQLRRDTSIARPMLKQFYGPNEVFFGDNFWKLYQVRWVRDETTRAMAARSIERSLPILTGHFAKIHLRALADAP